MTGKIDLVLVTGATGFIGCHVLDLLLSRGIHVRVAIRSQAKADALLAARPQHETRISTCLIEDFREGSSSLDDAVDGVTGIIHVASPFNYNITSNEQDLVLPAINGVKSILASAAKFSSVKRVVITSSFAAVIDASRERSPSHRYTAKDWNPQTYQESIDEKTTAVVGYRGSKKFAELAAWDFVKQHNPGFDLVTFCPPMVFGPPAHPIDDIAALNESNSTLWAVAKGEALPVARVPFWIDVRDLARAHVEGLLKPGLGGTRYTICSPERFSYELAADIMQKHFDWVKHRTTQPHEKQQIDLAHDLDGSTAAQELDLTYRSFEESVTDTIREVRNLPGAAESLGQA